MVGGTLADVVKSVDFSQQGDDSTPSLGKLDAMRKTKLTTVTCKHAAIEFLCEDLPAIQYRDSWTELWIEIPP